MLICINMDEDRLRKRDRTSRDQDFERFLLCKRTVYSDGNFS